MTFRTHGRKWLRHLIFSLSTFGTAFGVASDCDPQVRAAIFNGFQGLAGGFLDAFFIKLEQTDDSIVTVQARPIERREEVSPPRT